MTNEIDTLLRLVQKPSRYGGNEFNAIRKDWQSAELRMALVFPDLYEIGMSHQGLQILYHIVNGREKFLAERAYAPDLDLEDLLRTRGVPLFSLESRRSLREFDILGITLPYELCYTNILTILSLSGIPFRAAERNGQDPLVIGGGPCAFHSEPVADFFDAIFLGDGEEAVLEIAETVREAKRQGLSRGDVLGRLSRIEGVYIPSFFEPQYDGAGAFTGVRSMKPDYVRVSRRILPDLEATESFNPPLVPLTRIVHDRLGIEIARGCTRGCRFCQAGIIYRPVRERSLEKIMAMAEFGIKEGGFEEIALLSLSTGDYSCLGDLMVRLMNHFAEKHVSVSMPSMRVGTLTPEIMEQIRRVRKTGFTLAPEAGTDRLRRVINKGITEEDLLATTRAAFSLGWKLIKLYFMFGLPTEEPEDIEAIADLARKVQKTGGGGDRRVTASAATFVPKPHTPFEREPQLSVEDGYTRINRLKELLGRGKINLKWQDPRMSFLEGVFARGDRRLAGLIEEAWKRGARLDAWSDHFNLKLWQEAAQALNLELTAYLRRRTPEEPLPWDHLDVGVHGSFFSRELENAHKEIYTPDCRVHGCQDCGLCDHSLIKPVLAAEKLDTRRDEGETPALAQAFPRTATGGRSYGAGREEREPGKGGSPVPLKFIYRMDYKRLGPASLLSHLELLQVFFRAFQRAGLALDFSQGFNPTPKVSFSPAMPVGTESLAEFLYAELKEPLRDLENYPAVLNRHLPFGLEISKIAAGGTKPPDRIVTWYTIRGIPDPDPAQVEGFLRSGEFHVAVVRKGKERRIDVRPLVRDMRVTENCLGLGLIGESGAPGVKPLELVHALFGISMEQLQSARVLKERVEGI